VKELAASHAVRKVAMVLALACVGYVLTSAEVPLAQPAASSAARSAEMARSGQPATQLPEMRGLAQAPERHDAPVILDSVPAAEAVGVQGQGPLVIRFSKCMAVASLSARSITLVGPAGAEPVTVVPAEQGLLTFVWPGKELMPASRYTLFISGATDDAQRPLPLSAIGFDTAAKTSEASVAQVAERPEASRADRDAELARLSLAERQAVLQAERSADPEDWIPGPEHFKGRWHADRARSPLQSLSRLQAPVGITALSGQLLGMNGHAVAGVTLRIGERETRTDLTGRFLLQGIDPGFSKMEIDGASANGPDAHYGYYAARIEIKPNQTNVVPYVIWMPRLDPAGNVHIVAPTTAETVVTSPRIPGLELHIPAGTVIRDRQGRIVTELNLTAIPVDRPPFPVPDLGVPVYFTIQPGGAVLQSVTGKPGAGARLFYPNFRSEVPGARGVFWNYDPEDREWFVYGQGTISRDGKQAIPDEGVVIHELTGAMFNGGNTPPPNGPPTCDCGDSGGESVSLSTGQFQHTEHDAAQSDVTPIDMARAYDSADLNQRAFGIGMTHPYDQFLFSKNQWQEVDLVEPNGTRVHYARTSPGTGFADAIFESSDPGPWTHSIIARNQARAGWDMTLRSGRKAFFPQFQPVTELTDANGNTTRIVREANNGTSGKVTRIISPNGRTVDFSYNGAGFISALTDNLGRSYAYNYDATGHLVEVVDPLGGRRQYTWDTANHRITAIHDPNGNAVVQNEYDGAGRVHKQTFADGSSFTYAYTTQNGRISQTEVTDPRGSVRRVQFDSTGHVVKTVFPVGSPDEQITTYELSGGRIVASTDALNRRIEYEHDTAGNATRITRLAGTPKAITAFITYDPVLHRPLTITDPNGNTNTLAYDAKGNLIRSTNALGQSATFSYNAQGRLLTATDSLGRVMTTSYDGADLSSVTDALGRQTQYVTDAAGRVVATVDPLGNRSIRDWDDRNRLLSITDPLGGITAFTYDGNGNVIGHSDARSRTTTYTYNALNQVLGVRDALSQDTKRLYEPGGELTRLVDRNGQLSSIIYDALGRPTRIGMGATESNPAAFRSLIENTWDAANRLTQVVDKTCAEPLNQPNCASVSSVRVITRTYDELDRLTAEVTPQGEVDYGYDNGGRRTSMTVKNGLPGAQVTQPTVTYTYDNANRLVGISQAAGAVNGGVAQTITLAYDAAGQRTQATLANGTTVTYAHDNAGQLTAIVYKKADGSVIGDLLYDYDAGGRRVAMRGSLAQLNLPAADITDAAYDANDRLLVWGGKSYSYDAEGNLTSDGTSGYAWNERNQLASISNGASEIATFQYDSSGRRVGKTIGSTTTGFLYDGGNIVQELLGTTSTAVVKAHLLTGGVDEVFLRMEGNTGESRQSVLSDATNSTVMLLSAAQDKTVGYTYEPYGATTADTTSSNTQQYTGRENDNPGSDLGLYYHRARYYIPGNARFISEDPIGWASGQTNNYAYVGGNPISFRDPMGLDGWDDFENLSAGFGDALTFGLTRLIRDHFGDALGITGVDPCSGWYTAGEVIGTVGQMVATAGLGGEVKAVDAATRESLFYRFGTSYESATRLGKQAELAEASAIGKLRITGLHGVSVTASVPEIAASGATLEAIEAAGFRLVYTPTGLDTLHHTLVLPKPVTKEVADAFNGLFGRLQ